jgi:hypothetical protein
MDDSGTRHPDRKVTLAKHDHDYFALGGILVNDEDESLAKEMIKCFRSKWPQLEGMPLHSTEIRGCHQNFAWLGKDENTKYTFWADLEKLLLSLPVTGLACVIDRPGYNARYSEKYGRSKWALCKSAFSIAIERAAKFAGARDRKLRVYVEKCNKADDRAIRDYYDDLVDQGHYFNATTAAKYNPMAADSFSNSLYEFRFKEKSSPLMQIADLYLWPICIGGYDRKNRPYSRLVEAGKLVECRLPADRIAELGTKYFCFQATNNA